MQAKIELKCYSDSWAEKKKRKTPKCFTLGNQDGILAFSTNK